MNDEGQIPEGKRQKHTSEIGFQPSEIKLHKGNPGMSKGELWKDENEPQNTELPSVILEVPKNFRLQKSALTMLLAAPVEIELHEGNTGMSEGELWKDEVGSALQKSDF